MYRKHSFEEKLNLVIQAKNGQPLYLLSHTNHLDAKILREWVYKYDLYGEQGLYKQHNINSTPDLREEVVKLIIEKSITLPQVVLQYGISASTLKNWVKIAKTKG